jgi:MerR family copper efflux transcriptional regulator
MYGPGMTRYRISEVARPTGFSPSTLRYYEQVGLLSTERARNGYRVYGEADVARLRFIARAKRLGLSLGGIRELVSTWDGGRCEPVKARLSEMLQARSRAAAKRIGELVALEAELSGARRALAAATPAGPCDDSCGCAAGRDDPVIACTLGAPDLAERAREWAPMLDQATGRRKTDWGVSITFPARADLVGQLANLAVREQRCCAFMTFAILIADAEQVTLEVRAPQEALRLLPRLLGAE